MPKYSVLAAVVLLAAGPVWTETAPKKAAPATSTGAPAKPRMSDAQIEATIRAKFAKSKISTDKMQVHVQGGVATIEGKTDVVQHKGVATRMAKTGGALAVNNHVQISDAARQKAAANLETGRRRAQIKRGDDRSDARSQGTTTSRQSTARTSR